MEFPDNENVNTWCKISKLGGILSWVVRWSIVHKCQTLIKCIFNNIEVNCIGEIVP